MQYTVIINETSYDLPNYNDKTCDTLEKVEISNASNKAIKEKLKTMYNSIADLIGKQNVIDAIGKLEDADRNEINITYLKIVDSYNEPLKEFQKESSNNLLNDGQLDKLIEVLNALPQAEKMLRVTK